MNEPKKFDPSCSSFTANGRKYYVSKSISIARYEEHEKLQPKLSFDVDFNSLFTNIKRAYNHLNDRKFADSAVVLYNLMAAIDDVRNEKRLHPALQMAALMINREDEDPGVYDPKLQEEKIEDWKKEGYDAESFFLFALATISGFAKAFNEFTPEAIQKVNLKK